MSLDSQSVATKKSYKDATLALKDRKLGTFEVGRDIGAWLETLTQRPTRIGWQYRVLMEKIAALVRGRRGKSTTIINYCPDQRLLFRYLAVSVGLEAPCISYYSVTLEVDSRHNPLVGEIDDAIEKHVVTVSHAKELITKISSECDRFNIILIPPSLPEIQRSVAVRFVAGCVGVMFVRDFGLEKTPWPFEYLRQHNMVMIETADGYGECWAL
jgi:hypothetical protein